MQCDQCGRVFKLAHHLRRHAARKTPCVAVVKVVEPNQCAHCGNSFSTKGNLMKHYTRCTVAKNNPLQADRDMLMQLAEENKKIIKELEEIKRGLAGGAATGAAPAENVADHTVVNADTVNNTTNNGTINNVNNINNTVNNNITIVVNDIDKLDLDRVVLLANDFKHNVNLIYTVISKVFCDPNIPENSAICPDVSPEGGSGDILIKMQGTWRQSIIGAKITAYVNDIAIRLLKKRLQGDTLPPHLMEQWLNDKLRDFMYQECGISETDLRRLVHENRDLLTDVRNVSLAVCGGSEKK